MSRWCEKCGAKLGHRNPKRKAKGKYKCRELCQPCFNNPTEEERCIAFNQHKKRCGHRAKPESESGYCPLHMKKFGVTK